MRKPPSPPPLSPRHVWKCHLRGARDQRHDREVQPPIENCDVTTIMGLLGDIQLDVAQIRRLLEDEDGQEEEAPQDDS